jgi:putative proteasome-type protease
MPWLARRFLLRLTRGLTIDITGITAMTYCLGIVTKQGVVMASDSRTNAGFDQINVCRKMFVFEKPGEHVFVVLTSGSLSCSQSIVTLVQAEYEIGEGLAKANSMYDAARIIGEHVRRVADIDRGTLERDGFNFNVHLLLGGQVKGHPPDLYLIYPQGNPLRATEDSPFLQIGEVKYGRPILDRGIRFDHTTLEEAARYAMISIDSTMRSNVTVGPPIDLLVYERDTLKISRRRRFGERDPDLLQIRQQWEGALRKAVGDLAPVNMNGGAAETTGK